MKPRFTIIDHGQVAASFPLPTRAATDGFLYCARCGRATTKLEASLRYCYRGYSGCCNDYLLPAPPVNPVARATREQAEANERYKAEEPGE